MINFKFFLTITFVFILLITPLWAATPLPVGNYYFLSAGCEPCIKQSKIIERLEKVGINFKIYGPNDREEFKEQHITLTPTIIIVKKNKTIRLEGVQSFSKLFRLVNKLRGF